LKVGEQWQYANVRGGPDRRFKNNKLLPVMLYSYVEFRSAQGLNWVLQLSRHDVASWCQQIIWARPRRQLDAGADG
jgi:DNA polymerase-3 subunit epsilon